MDNIDFDFDLAEVSLDNNLPTIDNDYSDFSFDMSGGGSNNDSSDVKLQTLDFDDKLPGEELMEAPTNQNNVIAEEKEPKKIDVELVDEPMNNNDSLKGEKIADNDLVENQKPVNDEEPTNSEVLKQLPIVRKDEDGVNPDIKPVDLNLDDDMGLLSNDADENLNLPKKDGDIVLNLDEDETGGPVISENLDNANTLDTDKYLADLRKEVNEAKLNNNSSIVNDFEEIKKINKMLSSDYDEYIVKLRDFFKTMKGKKKNNYEFSILDNGNLVMVDKETNESEELIIPKYSNINNEIKMNKTQIGTLLYNISSVRKSIYLDEKNKFYSKNSEKFAALTRDLSNLTKRNNQLLEYKDIVENKELVDKNETLITDMKVEQAKNYLKIKEAKNDSAMTYQQEV